MLHEVRIYTSEGNLKNIVSSEQLRERHWKIYKKGDVTHSKLRNFYIKMYSDSEDSSKNIPADS